MGGVYESTLANGSWPKLDEAIDAGMKAIPHLGFYYGQKNADGTYGRFKLDHLKNCLDYIKDEYTMNSLLAYFIDNEIFERWEPMKEATDTVMQWEKNVTGGKRMAPIYMLNGSPGTEYLSYDEYGNKICHVGDINSTYFNSTGIKFKTLDHQNNQRMPANIAQINGNHKFRSRIYGSIIHGAKGMNFWTDWAPGNPGHIPNCYDDNDNPIPNCPDPNNTFHQHLFDDNNNILSDYLLSDGGFKQSNDITHAPWWDDLPNLVNEVHQMKNLIQQPHWTTTWSVSSCMVGNTTCENEAFLVGTRELYNKGYVMVANVGGSTATATIAVTGLPFINAPLKDFFTGTTITQMTNSQFQITLPSDGVGVYKIDKYIPPLTCLDNMMVSGNLSGLYKAGQIINTNGVTIAPSNENVRLKGDDRVVLESGFRAENGTDFRAYNEPCSEAFSCQTCPRLPNFTNCSDPFNSGFSSYYWFNFKDFNIQPNTAPQTQTLYNVLQGYNISGLNLQIIEETNNNLCDAYPCNGLSSGRMNLSQTNATDIIRIKANETHQYIIELGIVDQNEIISIFSESVVSGQTYSGMESVVQQSNGLPAIIRTAYYNGLEGISIQGAGVGLDNSATVTIITDPASDLIIRYQGIGNITKYGNLRIGKIQCDGVTIYQHCNYGGTSATIGIGAYQLGGNLFPNDILSALTIPSGYKVTLYEEYNFSGNSLVLTSDDACLIDNGYNDEASSIIVEAI